MSVTAEVLSGFKGMPVGSFCLHECDTARIIFRLTKTLSMVNRTEALFDAT